MTNRKRNDIYYTLCGLLLLLLGSSCNISKSIPENEHLLNKNIIKNDKPEYNEDMVAIIKQKPNRKILGLFRFHLGVYHFANSGKERKIKTWMKTAIGEKPVLLDTFLTTKSSQQLEIFMQNNGYFNAVVTDTTIYRRKKAKVIYFIKSGLPYSYRNIYTNIPDTAIQRIVLGDTSNSLIKTGKRYSANTLQKERDRITTLIKNKGYYNFNPLYITFKADSSLKNNQADLWMNISNPRPMNNDTSLQTDTIFNRHRINYFKEVTVEMDYDPIQTYSFGVKDTVPYEGLRFVTKGIMLKQFKPKHFSEHIFTRTDSTYSQADIDLTYRRLSDLGIFRFVNLRVENMPGLDSAGRVPLKCNILLAPQERQEIKLEFEGTNNGGNFGIAGNLVYRNKNFFKGAETFTFKMKGGLELQQNFGDTTYESTRRLAIFNAYEIGPEITINFPRALWPFTTRNPKRISNPTTSVNTGFNTQNRPEYFRQLFNLSYYYTKKTTRYNRIFFYPAEINYLNVELDPAFKKQLTELNDVNLVLGYTDQFIANGRFSYVFNNQELNVRKKYLFFRVNFEFAGNSLYLTKAVTGETPSANKPSSLFKVQFAQYIRPDIDLRLYAPLFFNNSQLVFRIAGGLGYAYGNSVQLPFEKSFYAGGPNDIRAWRTRQLGPGSNTKEDFFERFGDIKITGNAEYRFDIFRKLKGAAFIDAGNIWLLEASANREAGVFKADKFLDQIAIGSGLGLRFDFTFFIIRLDGAIQIKDPSKPQDERWVFNANKFSDIIFNFGIGYPF